MPNESIVGSAFELFGLSGTPVPTGGIVPRLISPQNQDLLDREFNAFGEVQNPDLWVRFTNMLNRPTSFTAMLEMWEQMSLWDLLAAALVQVVDEATQTDSSCPGTLWYECDDPKVEEDLNDMLENVGMEELIASQVWHLAALGNNFDKVEYARGEGVLGLTYVHPTRMRRYWLRRNRQCIGFHWADGKPDKTDIFKQGNNDIQRQTLGGSGTVDTENLWYPWDFMHMRRMYRMRESEHGEPIFEEAQGIYRKLRIALDQMVVHRAQVQPDRYVVNIDVQDLPPADQMKTVQRWKQQLRSRLSFGNVDQEISDFKSFYQALALDSTLYMARPRGFQHSIEKLPGTVNVPDVYDIEMLTNLFFSVIGMPKEWLGGTQSEGGPTSGRALLAQDIRFLRKIKALRRPLTHSYTWLGYFHLVLKGQDIRNVNLEARMPDIGSLEDQLKLETLKLQSEVMNSLGDAMEKFNLPKEAWIDLVFRKYMRLDQEIVNTFLTALPPDAEQQESKASREPRSSRTTKLLEEIEKSLGRSERAQMLLNSLRETVNGKLPARHRRLDEGKVVRMPKIKPNDLVVSSFGRDPLLENRATGGDGGGGPDTPKSGWRRFNYAV